MSAYCRILRDCPLRGCPFRRRPRPVRPPRVARAWEWWLAYALAVAVVTAAGVLSRLMRP